MEQNRYKYLDEKGEHMHTLDGAPLFGTSTIVDVLKKEGLTWWASGLAVAQLGCPDGKLLTKIKNKKATPEEKELLETSLNIKHEEIAKMSSDEYFSLVDTAYRAHSLKLADSAQAGTDMHAELEKYVKLMISDQDSVPMAMNGYEHRAVELFANWAIKNVKRFLWSEINCYSERFWVGGISDLGYEKHDGTIGIMDFKSSKEAYLSQFFQCAGYDIQIGENGGVDKDGNKVFQLPEGASISEYAVFPFGMKEPEPQFHTDIAGAKGCFLACLTLHKKMNV